MHQVSSLECWSVPCLSEYLCWTCISLLYCEWKQGNLWQSHGRSLDLWLYVSSLLWGFNPYLDVQFGQHLDCISGCRPDHLRCPNVANRKNNPVEELINDSLLIHKGESLVLKNYFLIIIVWIHWLLKLFGISCFEHLWLNEMHIKIVFMTVKIKTITIAVKTLSLNQLLVSKFTFMIIFLKYKIVTIL